MRSFSAWLAATQSALGAGWVNRLSRRRPTRIVVIDVESTGLDPRRDALLAVAGVALRVDWSSGLALVLPGDSFESEIFCPLQADEGNVLVHGIGAGSRSAAPPASVVLPRFLGWMGDAPATGFHAAFDQTLIARALQPLALSLPGGPWLDIEHMCAGLYSEQGRRPLGDWLDYFGLTVGQRHNAACDALAQAELLARIWPHCLRTARDWRGLKRLARAHRWLATQQ